MMSPQSFFHVSAFFLAFFSVYVYIPIMESERETPNGETKMTRILHTQTFEDASGAEMLVEIDGERFACNLTGKISVFPVGCGSYRKPSKKALNIAEWTYKKWLATLPDGFLAANEALYTA